MTEETDPVTKIPLSENLKALSVSFGDNVRVIDTPVTQELGISGLQGSVFGETTPSQTGVKVYGELRTDAAINVFFENLGKDYWLSPDLVEFVDHGAGATFEIGNDKWERTEDGQWQQKPKDD